MYNRLMRVLAIGDIHGCSKALDLVLESANPADDDLVVTLGDYVDRGPDSAGVIERLLALRQRCRLVCLRGNHEIMMLAARADEERRGLWLGYGGKETLASYSKSLFGGKLAHVPEHHWQFLEQGLVDHYETETHFFVHANAYPEIALAEQPDVILYWEPFRDLGAHDNGKIMVCGHTTQKAGVPLLLEHAICIDTWVYGQGWLTCLDVNTGQLWQANQQGEKRHARLEDVANREG